MPRHVATVPVRWSDTDQLGHVNNVVLLRYLQEARVDLLFRDAAERGLGEFASGVLVHKHDVSYQAPVTIKADPDGRPLPVRVDLQVTQVTAASFEIGYEVHDSDGAVCATAATVLVPYDLVGGHLRRLTPDERVVLDGLRGEPRSWDGHLPVSWPGGPAAYRTDCAVRFDDLDSYGHVNNVIISEYLQQARINLNVLLNALREPHERQVVGRIVIDYLRPISFRTVPVSVDVVVTRVGTSSFDLAYEVRDDAEIFARAASTMVAYDVAAVESRPLNNEERDALEQLRAPARTAA